MAPRCLPLVVTIRSGGGGQSWSRVPRIKIPEASQRPATLQILLVDDTVPRGAGKPYVQVFGNCWEVVVRDGTGRQQLTGVAAGSACAPRQDVPLLGLLGLAAFLLFPLLPEFLLQPRAHQYGQANQRAEDKQTANEEYEYHRKIPEQLQGTQLFFAITTIAAASNLVDGGVERPFRRRFRRGREKGKRDADPFRGVTTGYIPIVGGAGDFGDAGNGDRLGPTFQFSQSEFRAVLDCTEVERRGMTVARQAVMAIVMVVVVVMVVVLIGQHIGVFKACERPDEEWKDRCHFLVRSLIVARDGLKSLWGDE